MANDAVAMLNPPRRKRVKEKGWWLRCEVRGGKNQVGKLCWQTRDGRVFLWFLLGLGGGGAQAAGAQGLQRRWVWVAGKKDWEDLASQAR